MEKLGDAKNRYEFALDGRQAGLIVSGLILVLMLSFLMGTLFGRNLAATPDDNSMNLASSQLVVEEGTAKGADMAVTGEESAAPEAGGESNPENWPVGSEASRDDFIKELESMKVPTKVEEGEDMEGDPIAPMLASMKVEEPASDETEKTEQPAPKPEPEKAVKPAAPKAPVVAGSYTIQLASFPEKGDADSLVEDLQGKKYDAYLLHVAIPGKGSFYRVRVGHYKDLDQAEKARRILQAREGKFFDAWITQ